MNSKDAEFHKRLLSMFKIEATEHIETLAAGLIELERAPAAPGQIEVLESIYREAHSLKGAARAVNMQQVERVCQALETLFAALQRNELSLEPALFDLLHESVNLLNEFLQAGEAEPHEDLRLWARTLVDRLEGVAREGMSAARQGGHPVTRREGKPSGKERPAAPQSHPSQPVAEKKGAAETVRIATRKLDSLLLQTEELLAGKQALSQRVAELREIQGILQGWRKEWGKLLPTVRSLQRSLDQAEREPNSRRDMQVERLLEGIERSDGYLRALEGRLVGFGRLLEQEQRSLAGMVDGLLEDMKKVQMLPFSSLLESLPKLVRDLSRDQGKEVVLLYEGGEIEIDRRILEEIKDPLLHLLRNGVDHGIEYPAIRMQQGKVPEGTIRITVAPRDSHQVEIAIADNGAGIDPEQVRQAALKLGVISAKEAEKLNEQESVALIFESGISTSPIITDISGRGLGLAIVREKVERLRGLLSVTSQRGEGTTFRILLPLTLATFRGVLVRVQRSLFVVPAGTVERVARVTREDIRTIENRETVQLDGRVMPVVELAEVLELDGHDRPEGREEVQLLVLALGQERVAFLVDELVREQEVLVKSLGKQLSRVRNVAGATILGTGEVVLLLNVSDLMKSAARGGGQARAAAGRSQQETRKKSILVAEDSITSRTLIKNILKAAGYEVQTAVDGVEAYTMLRSNHFDLVVSDVDMPRMNGFALTAKIRRDEQLSGIPIVLVTALESREDREHGIDVGANAYIVKSSFDQSNLVEVIGRLV